MKNKIVYDGRTFEATDIKSGQIHLAASLPSMKLEPNTIIVVVKSEEDLTKFTRNTPMYYYHRERLVCISYIQTVDRIGPDKYKLYGTSAVGRLIERSHTGGIYTGQAFEQIVKEICGDIPVIIKDGLKGVALYGWLPYAKPPKRSARDNLAQALFAVGASLKTDLDGILRIEFLWDGLSGAAEKEKIYVGAKSTYETPFDSVSVTEHQYMEGGEEAKLFEGTTQAGDIITFSEPMYALSASGFTILESNANYAKVSAGSGALTGRKYIHNTRQVTRHVGQARSGDGENVRTVSDATLVSLVNSVAVAERLANYYACQETIQSDIVLNRQSPGDVVSFYHPYDKRVVSACIESLDINVSGTLKAQTKALVGFSPLQMEDTEYFDERVVLTGSGTFEVPYGVTSIRCVCIAAGDGGDSGASGDDAAVPEHTALYGAYKNGSGGQGGKGGKVGVNGKVYIEVIDVSPHEVIPYSCGVGGMGGACVKGEGNGIGGKGGNTTFGPISSQYGTSTEDGYFDETTGERYANTVSLAGINGGDGSGTTGADMDEFIRGPSVFDRSGHEWVSGVTGDNIPANKVYLTSVGVNDLYIVSKSGSGGGAAAGENGANGYPNSVTETTVYTGTGGNGATARIIPNKQSNYGSGGHGGHGGGGAGGAGGCLAQYEPDKKTYLLGPNGIGGMGSMGGDGGDGCIILFYAKPKKFGSGAFLTQDGRFFLDGLGRFFVG